MRWIGKAQILAITVLGIAVLLPFAMAAGILALAAAIVLVGPIGLARFLRRGAGRDPAAADRGGEPPCVLGP